MGLNSAHRIRCVLFALYNVLGILILRKKMYVWIFYRAGKFFSSSLLGYLAGLIIKLM